MRPPVGFILIYVQAEANEFGRKILLFGVNISAFLGKNPVL